jgi:hypothetical protein
VSASRPWTTRRRGSSPTSGWIGSPAWALGSAALGTTGGRLPRSAPIAGDALSPSRTRPLAAGARCWRRPGRWPEPAARGCKGLRPGRCGPARAARRGRPVSERRAARRCYGQRCGGPMSGRRAVLPAGSFGHAHARGVRPTWRICCGRAARVPILGAVIGADFAAVLSAAQQGDEGAFSQASDDVAAETWVQVVRGLRRFRGDEAVWRAWVFTTACRVIDASRRRAWLFTTARRCVIDASRCRSCRREEPLDELPAARRWTPRRPPACRRGVLPGEIHGTREFPALAGEVARYCATVGIPLLLSLELPGEEQPALDQFLDTQDATARTKLLAGAFWSRQRPDGGSRAAMAGLFDALRQLRRSDAEVRRLPAPRASGRAAATLGMDIGLASRTAPIKASVLAAITRCRIAPPGRTVARDWRPLLRSSRPALCSKGVRCEAAIA